MKGEEEVLYGGNVSGGVIRIGDTVRRPVGEWSPAVHELLRHLETAGFDGAPKFFGIDDLGREVLEYIPGVVPYDERHHPYLGTEHAVRRVGQLLRRFHDAVASFKSLQMSAWREPERADDAAKFVDERGMIVCHNDPAAWNLVIGDKRWAFIDWDFAGPRPFIWDVAYSLISILPVVPNPDHLGWKQPVPFTSRLKEFANGYGLEDRDRARLIEVMCARIRDSYDHLRTKAQAGVQPWLTLWKEGHGGGWSAMYAFANEHRAEWERDLLESK